jgi:alkylation response protein AidB-like acyl-CoA dehydrogenase
MAGLPCGVTHVTQRVKVDVMYSGNSDMPDDGFAIPDDLRAHAAEIGLFGYALPRECGGPGLDPAQDAHSAHTGQS